MGLQLAGDRHRRHPEVLLQQPAEQDAALASMEDIGLPRALGTIQRSWHDPALLARQRRRQSAMPFAQAVLSARKHAAVFGSSTV